MKKLLQRLVVLALVLVLLLGGILVVWIDSIAKTGIEKAGTYALGVATTVEDVNIGVLGGGVEIAGLEVANPEGFDTPHFVQLSDGAVDASISTLRETPSRVASINLDGLDMNLQKTGGKANYEVILENLKRFESEEPDPEGTSHPFVIEEVRVTNIMVHTNLAPVIGQLTTMDIELDEIVLQDVGSEGKPVGLDKVIALVIQAVFASIVQSGIELPGDILNGLGEGLEQLVSLEAAGVIVDGAVEIIGGTVEGVGKGLEGIGEGVDGALKGVGDLLGGGSKKKDGN